MDLAAISALADSKNSTLISPATDVTVAEEGIPRIEIRPLLVAISTCALSGIFIVMSMGTIEALEAPETFGPRTARITKPRFLLSITTDEPFDEAAPSLVVT